MEQQLTDLIGDRLTAHKAAGICSGGSFNISGVVLLDEAGNRFIVELGAVHWLGQSQMWRYMHPNAPDAEADRDH